MGRGSGTSRASAQAQALQGTRLSKNSSKDNFDIDVDTLISEYETGREVGEIDFINKVNQMLPEAWRPPEGTGVEPAITALRAYNYYNRYKNDPYRLYTHKQIHAGTFTRENRGRSYAQAFDTLLEENLPPFQEALEKNFASNGITDYSAEDLARETLTLIYASKNTFSPKSVRKLYTAQNARVRLPQQVVEQVIAAFDSYEYEPPEVFIS